MKKIDIVLAFNDREYADALARYFAQYEKNMNVAVREYDYRRTGKNEIIIRDYEKEDEGEIIGDDYRNSGEEKDTSGNSVKENGVNITNSAEIRFDGFCDTETLVKEIRRIGGSMSYPERAGNKNDMRIVFVTGSSGGAGVSSVASALCTELTVYHGKSVMLLDFSPFPETGGGAACRSVKELIYLLGCEKDDNGATCAHSRCMPQFKHFVFTDYDGIGRLNYGDDVNYLSRAMTDEIIAFFQYLFETGDFDYVITDISILQLVRLHYESGFVFSEIADAIVSVSDGRKAAEADEKNETAGTAAEKGETTNAKAEKYEDFINKIKDYNHEIKIIKAENFCGADTFISDKDNDKDSEKILIDYDTDSFSGGSVRIEGSFGIAIKNIAHRLVFC